RATDNGLPSLSTAQVVLITVHNVAPTADVVGAPASSPEGTAISLGATATDPSPVDTAAGFSYAWSVTKDGNPYAAGSGVNFAFTVNWGDGSTQTLAGPSGMQVGHIYTASGSYVVQLTAADKDGGISAVVSQGITIEALALQGDVLVIGGTLAADRILIRRDG